MSDANDSLISADSLVWALRVAPTLANNLVVLWRDVYLLGARGRSLQWDKGWTPVFQARVELLEITTVVYLLGKLAVVLGTEMRIVVLIPGHSDVVLKTPIVVPPFPSPF